MPEGDILVVRKTGAKDTPWETFSTVHSDEPIAKLIDYRQFATAEEAKMFVDLVVP